MGFWDWDQECRDLGLGMWGWDLGTEDWDPEFGIGSWHLGMWE